MQATSDPKRQLFDQFARVTKALGSGARLEIVDFLSQTERTVDSLASLSGLTVANVSQHLQVLKRAGLVDSRKEGLHVHYRLADEQVFRLWRSVRFVAESRLAEVERMVNTFFKDRATLEPVTMDQLKQRMTAGEVTVIDVRPYEEYATAHIPGALSLPVAELAERLKDLPKDRIIVAYCRGPYCVQSDQAVAFLRERGFEASRLEAGLPDWKADGFGVESVTAGASGKGGR